MMIPTKHHTRLANVVRPLSSVRRVCLAASLFLCPSAPAFAQQEPPTEEVFVWGRRLDSIGSAHSASEGVVEYGDYADRPLLRVGELTEVIPGVAATQHSGTGKANQFFLRGFNIDHGTDFSVSLDGVPLNLPTHAHGQGYLDLNAIIPEAFSSITWRKGTYFAQNGDFSAAGSSAMELFDLLPQSFVQGTVGPNGYYRALGGANLGTKGYVVGDLTFSDGPWDRPENLEKLNLLGRFAFGNWALTGLAYDASWDATDQIPLRAVEARLISRLGAIDITDGGESARYIVSLRNRDLTGFDTLAYLQRYHLDLWSNFTYLLDDPVNGDQFQQHDERWIYGASIARAFAGPAGWEFAGGAHLRIDDIGKVALYRTRAREILSTTREDSVVEWQGGAWAEATRTFGALRAALGGRFDAIGADVKSDNPLNSGDAGDTLFSPKLTLAWGLSPQFELYANVGRGFHSNDARGATITVDPVTGDPAARVALYAAATGAEGGFRWETDQLSLSSALWWLRLDSELVFVGDAGGTEASGETGRTGLEVLAEWRPFPRLHFDVSAAATRARALGSPGEDRIPNALEYVVSSGVSALITDELVATLTLRHLGEAPLTEDNSVRSPPATIANALLRYKIGSITLTGEVLNVFNSGDSDIQYFYTSRLPGEPTDGIDDVHFHPAELRTFRVGLRFAF
jgi:hypothetical protein